MLVTLEAALALPGAVIHDGGVVHDGGAVVTYAINEAHAVIVVAAGDRAGGSRIRTADTIVLIGPFPPEAARRLSADGSLSLTAFARLAEGLLPLGEVRRIGCTSRDGSLDEVELFIVNPLSDELLDTVRPTAPAPPQPPLDWLGLLPPVSAVAAAVALERFVGGWFADDPPGTPGSWGPEPLRAFHRAAAGRDAVYGTGAHIYREPLDAPPRPDGLIPFGQESDGVFRMLFDPAHPDLPVYHDSGGTGTDADVGRPVRECDSLSAFLMHFVLAQAAVGAPIGGMAIASAEQTRRLTAGLRRVPLTPLSWPGAEMYTYAAPGLIVHAGRQVPDEQWHEVHVGARHRALLRPLRPLGLEWEVFHD
jgi:hypothetical protein